MTDGAPKPMRVQRTVYTVCWTRPRRCERVASLSCETCSWHGAVDGEGQGDLFAPAEHDQAECNRRQTDPEFRREQDQAWRAAAGLATD